MLLPERIFTLAEHTKSFNVWNGWKNETSFHEKYGGEGAEKGMSLIAAFCYQKPHII